MAATGDAAAGGVAGRGPAAGRAAEAQADAASGAGSTSAASEAAGRQAQAPLTSSPPSGSEAGSDGACLNLDALWTEHPATLMDVMMAIPALIQAVHLEKLSPNQLAFGACFAGKSWALHVDPKVAS